ncbi:hypothetical protein ALO_20787 [Acetonema longum DSM 6540]|uniref:Uncharacterized protein n=1 Tax=Acetonema longum DSM 6540 TaxID=1009370 RepID=F7NPW0_9FIRM|nr:hypothetical protein ALO_20787 [Acetonema longum DSM 6540]
MASNLGSFKKVQMLGKSNACVVILKNLGDFSAYEKTAAITLFPKSHILIARRGRARDCTFGRCVERPQENEVTQIGLFQRSPN